MRTALSVFLHRVTGLLLLTGIFASILPLAAAPYERIQTLSMDDGLPHSDVNAIVQDPDGYLWFATFSGLCKYDGYRIQTFRTDNSNLSSDRVLTLFIARDSSLYIGTESGGLNRYNPATESITPINDESHASADQVVNDIFQDHDGTIWICRNDGLACLDTRNGGSSLRSKPRWRGYYIQCGTVLEDGRLLLSTDAGPVIYNPETEEIQNVLRDEIRSRCLSIRTLRDGKIALSGGWGVRILDPESRKVSRICDFSSRIVFQDSHGELWVGAFNQGLYKYDANGAQLAHYHPKLPIPHAISSFEISALFEDRSGVLWIGTIGGGLNRLNIVEKHIACFTEAQGLSENRVITFLEARDGTLWVSTHGGIDLFDRRSESFRNLRINGMPSIRFATVSAFFTAQNGDLWIGTWDKGLWIVSRKEVEQAPTSGEIQARQLRHPAIDGALSVFRIVEDRDRHLWISSNRGCFEYIPAAPGGVDRWINYAHDVNGPNSLCSDFTTDICPDPATREKTIWIGTRSGLNRIRFDARGKANCQRIELGNAGNTAKRRNPFISTIHCDRQNGDLWIATIGEGLFRMSEGRNGGETPRFEGFDTSNTQLFNNELESLQEDDHGAFWIGGYGITRFDPRTRSVRHFTVKDQLQSNSFKIWASCRLRDGQMAFGGVKGFNIFHPDSITDNNIRPRAAISRLRIRNRVVHAGDSIRGKVVLPKAVNRLERLELSYRCNNLTFEFSAFAYVDPQYNTYKYRMENFDHDWNYTGGMSPQAVYTSLRPGNYRLVVYAANEDGYWCDEPARLEIVIHPPLYATRVAYLLYICLAALGIYAWHRRSLRKLQERHQIELERNKYYEEQKSSANMLQFYTDIAHELKTPLSLIAAPVEELLMNPHIGETTRKRLELVSRNTAALTTLLEQILDLRKYENHKMNLAAVQTDLTQFLRRVAELFRPLADNLRIRFSIELPETPIFVRMDRDKMETVVVNLLYNAFKYTRKGSGKVTLSCEERQHEVAILVEDNGIGIARNEQTRIFERFYQASNNNAAQKSVGIGLALSKHIVELHHGTIEVESELNVGSLFRVLLPKGSAHLSPEQIKEPDEVPDHRLQRLPAQIEEELTAASAGMESQTPDGRSAETSRDGEASGESGPLAGADARAAAGTTGTYSATAGTTGTGSAATGTTGKGSAPAGSGRFVAEDAVGTGNAAAGPARPGHVTAGPGSSAGRPESRAEVNGSVVGAAGAGMAGAGSATAGLERAGLERAGQERTGQNRAEDGTGNTAAGTIGTGRTTAGQGSSADRTSGSARAAAGSSGSEKAAGGRGESAARQARRYGIEKGSGRSVSILVAEDNPALRDYLHAALQGRYDVITASNGQEALSLAVEQQPDLVLTDIVMPGMTGIELCRRLKEEPQTAQIAVILLTAHNLQDYEISGYRVGADGYIAKPFSLEVLFSRIDNLVARQEMIRRTQLPHAEIPVSEVSVEKSQDRFLVKCTETVEQEMADPQFDVQQLCRKTGVSRSLLYRRLLALTGLTPVQFIRNIRLRHAAQLLSKDGSLPVSEVMYRVGYTNLSHFAKIFHDEFGLLPKEFALQGRNRAENEPQKDEHLKV